MSTLTTKEDAEATVWVAVMDGLVSGGLAAIPSSLAVYAAMNFSPKFVRGTNWQSRTALVIMPALFAFASSAESKLVQEIHEKKGRKQHSQQMAEWSQEKQLYEHGQKLQRMSTQKILIQPGMSLATTSEVYDEEHEAKVTAKFRESVVNSGVRVVGDSLGVQHKIANFWQENPFKILIAAGVPSVLYIFKGREGQKHLQLQSMLMHTRVYGQFAVLTMLLGLMGFKEYMDRSGKFITEEEVQARVAQMQQSRGELLWRLQRDRDAAGKVAEKRRKAHEADMKSSEAKKMLKDA